MTLPLDSRNLAMSVRGREWYAVTITTDPEVTGWEASFDQGATWQPGQAVAGAENTWRWLVHGPDFDPTDEAFEQVTSALVPTSDFWPLLRAVDNPEVVIIYGPPITLVQA